MFLYPATELQLFGSEILMRRLALGMTYRKSWFLFALLMLTPYLRAAIPAPERAALVALHTSTAGASWTNQTGWLGDAGTECQWFGVTMTTKSSRRSAGIRLSAAAISP